MQKLCTFTIFENRFSYKSSKIGDLMYTFCVHLKIHEPPTHPMHMWTCTWNCTFTLQTPLYAHHKVWTPRTIENIAIRVAILVQKYFENHHSLPKTDTLRLSVNLAHIHLLPWKWYVCRLLTGSETDFLFLPGHFLHLVTCAGTSSIKFLTSIPIF